MSARFRVLDVYTITGRGPVLRGIVLDGSIQIGMEIEPLDVDGTSHRLEVVGVEFIRLVDHADDQIGLLVEGVETESLRRALPEAGVIRLVDPA